MNESLRIPRHAQRTTTSAETFFMKGFSVETSPPAIHDKQPLIVNSGPERGSPHFSDFNMECEQNKSIFHSHAFP